MHCNLRATNQLALLRLGITNAVQSFPSTLIQTTNTKTNVALFFTRQTTDIFPIAACRPGKVSHEYRVSSVTHTSPRYYSHDPMTNRRHKQAATFRQQSALTQETDDTKNTLGVVCGGGGWNAPTAPTEHAKGTRRRFLSILFFFFSHFFGAAFAAGTPSSSRLRFPLRMDRSRCYEASKPIRRSASVT